MTQRASARQRIAASILGTDRSGRRPPTLERRRRLPLGRRVLASLVGIGVRPAAPVKPAPAAMAPSAPEHAPERTMPEKAAGASRGEHADHVSEAVSMPHSTSRRTPGTTVPPNDRFALAVHLRREDRSDYERTVDAALLSAPHRPELAVFGKRLNVEQARTMVLNATAIVTAAAGREYDHYVRVREEAQKGSAMSTPSETVPGVPGAVTTADEATETDGAGAVAVLAVLGPVLAGTCAAVFLLVGYILRMLNPQTVSAQKLITTGWFFGAVAGVSLLVAAVGLLLTALRNSPGRPPGEDDDEVTRAREAWLEALLERGIMPFLQEALADPASADSLQRTRPPSPYSRMPGSTRPDFASPDFTAPDSGGPEHRPE
ncbi:hypothetical protein ACF081_26535 [Streptomyces longwoodensis]|uniref:hypothetical protein n=1 Tax=Streptomyces longwoodensis TaxID=68231 RepID=UPI0036FA7D30